MLTNVRPESDERARAPSMYFPSITCGTERILFTCPNQDLSYRRGHSDRDAPRRTARAPGVSPRGRIKESYGTILEIKVENTVMVTRISQAKTEMSPLKRVMISRMITAPASPHASAQSKQKESPLPWEDVLLSFSVHPADRGGGGGGGESRHPQSRA